MKRGKPRAPREEFRTEERVRNARLHFFGGFVGERDGENVSGRDTLGDEISHAEVMARVCQCGAGED